MEQPAPAQMRRWHVPYAQWPPRELNQFEKDVDILEAWYLEEDEDEDDEDEDEKNGWGMNNELVFVDLDLWQRHDRAAVDDESVTMQNDRELWTFLRSENVTATMHIRGQHIRTQDALSLAAALRERGIRAACPASISIATRGGFESDEAARVLGDAACAAGVSTLALLANARASLFLRAVGGVQRYTFLHVGAQSDPSHVRACILALAATQRDGALTLVHEHYNHKDGPWVQSIATALAGTTWRYIAMQTTEMIASPFTAWVTQAIVSSNAAVKNMAIELCNVEPDSVLGLARVPTLETLALSIRGHLQDATWSSLAAELRAMKHLRRLGLVIHWDQFDSYSRLLSAAPQISELYIKRINTQVETDPILDVICDKMHNLRTLRISGSIIARNCHKIAQLKRLRVLELHGVQGAGAACAALITQLPDLVRMRAGDATDGILPFRDPALYLASLASPLTPIIRGLDGDSGVRMRRARIAREAAVAVLADGAETRAPIAALWRRDGDHHIRTRVMQWLLPLVEGAQ